MSLRAIHMVFIILCIALAAGFSVWCYDHGLKIMGTVSAAMVPVLVAYFVWFRKKSQGMGSGS